MLLYRICLVSSENLDSLKYKTNKFLCFVNTLWFRKDIATPIKDNRFTLFIYSLFPRNMSFDEGSAPSGLGTSRDYL